MVRKNRKKITFRYYELPRDSYVLPMLGGSWIRRSEHENPELHYHNLLEIGYCCQGEGEVILEKGVYPYFPETFTIIPRSCPHATLLGGASGITCLWMWKNFWGIYILAGAGLWRKLPGGSIRIRIFSRTVPIQCWGIWYRE